MKAFECTASALIIRELPDGRDTGNRIIRAQRVIAHGESFDDAWLYVEAPTGAGWSARRYLRPAEIAVVDPKWVPVPRGRAGIVATYGEPCTPLCTAGKVFMPAPLPLSWKPAERITSFSCHPLVAAPMQSALVEVHKRGLWGELNDYGGCYQCRTKRGTGQKDSTHSWAISVDLDTLRNPLGRKPVMNMTVVAIFEDHGFEWGGRWSRPDGMHFQRATGY